MKIGFYLPSSARVVTGGFKVLFEYADYLAGEGHEIVLYYDLSFSFKNHNINNIFLKKIYGKYCEKRHPQWYKFKNKVKKYAIYKNTQVKDGDIIICSQAFTPKLVKELSPSKGEKVYIIQDYENWFVSDAELLSTYKMGMTNIVVSTWLKQIVDKQASMPSFCIPNGININIFKPLPNVERIRHSICFHYRSEFYKGSDIAIKVIEIIKKRYDDLIVHVIGIQSEVELPSYCVYHHNITPSEIARINNSIQVFLCTSRDEGYGLPGLEAMACGTALVSTGYKGVFEYAIDYNETTGEGNALICNIDDVDSLVNKIVTLFENESLYQKITRNGIMQAGTMSIEHQGKMLENILLSIRKKGYENNT